MTKKETAITKDASNKKLLIVREFDATPDEVWKAWTESELLDQWWAPKPWKANTVSMDFREGGLWLYYMQGPNGEKSYCRVDFRSITPGRTIVSEATFCDEQGIVANDFPVMYWKNDFQSTSTGAKVVVELSFDSEADLEKIVAMGFKEGFTMGLGNLDELLAAK